MTMESLFQKFEAGLDFQVQWAWAPATRVGMATYRLLCERQIPRVQWKAMLKNLSFVSLPRDLAAEAKLWRLPIDVDGVITSLDPRTHIEKTWSWIESPEPDRVVGISVDLLRKKIEEHPEIDLAQWTPEVDCSELDLAKILTTVPELAKKNDKLSAWDRFILAEALVGTLVFSSRISFKRR
jgi:hypothetical protein